MQKVAIVTDSVACLTRELVEQYRIGIVPVRLLVQGKVYRDLVDMTPSQAYRMFLQDPASFNTSPSSPGHYLEAYREASRIAPSILCVTISSGSAPAMIWHVSPGNRLKPSYHRPQ